MSEATPITRSEEEMAANARKLHAEAVVAEREAKLKDIEIAGQRLELEVTETVVTGVRDKHYAYLASDEKHRVYRFLGSVTAASAKEAVGKLALWSRLDPGCDISIIIDSPGGDIIAGFHLYDEIQALRGRGHKVTTKSRGMAASMGGVLLQAGDERVMGAQASMLIHEAQFGAIGSFGEIEDQVEFVKKLQDRILGILAERSTLTKRQIKTRWTRKNWWLMADEALELGFIDRIE